MVEVVVTIRHVKILRATIKEISPDTAVMDIISKEANVIESGIINKINNIGTHTTEIRIGPTVIIIQWLNQQIVTLITDMMNDGVKGSQKEIIMAVATRLNESSTLKAVEE